LQLSFHHFLKNYNVNWERLSILIFYRTNNYFQFLQAVFVMVRQLTDTRQKQIFFSITRWTMSSATHI
jgi:hypothetical protein